MQEDDDVDGELESNDQLTDAATDEEWTDEEDDNHEEIVDNFVEGINMDETSLDYIPQMIKDVIDKTREIINTIKGSSILTSFIEKKRLHFNARVKKQKKIKRRLIIDVKTRWNSTYKMLHTINLYRNLINDLFKSKGTLGLSVKLRRKLTRVELSTDEWDILNLIISLLYPFYSATKVLSNTKYPTVGSALYLMKGLEEHLTKEDNNELLNNLKKIIFNKFGQYIIDDVEQFNTLKFLLVVVLRPDSLSIHEQDFYKVYGNHAPTPPELVETLEDFKNNLINRFRFDKISPFIDFNHFVLAGGSVLMCFLRNTSQFINSDLDFFYIGQDFKHFINILSNIYGNLCDYYFVKQRVLSNRRVYELEITLGSTIFEIINESHTRKKLTLQFIYHPSITSIETYLMAFDLDIIQMCFNGEKVLSTWACIRALNTGTFICYNLTNNLTTLARSAIRIIYELGHIQNLNYYSSTKEQFGINFTQAFTPNLKMSLGNSIKLMKIKIV
ncbi:unnamed protein product [Rotaria sp. Silwood1]|nr:unnamed protein product [Rotaria sp. Silwood1]